MFARSRVSTVRAFTPPALPGFTAIPALIPVQSPFGSLPVTVACHTRSLTLEPRAYWPAWLILGHHVLLDAVCDPGTESSTRLSAPLPVACGPRESLSRSHLFHFGANYRIQRLTLHLTTFPQLHASQLALGVEFPISLFRIVSWVPSYTMTRLTHFDENMGWLTRPSPSRASHPIDQQPFPGFPPVQRHVELSAARRWHTAET